MKLRISSHGKSLLAVGLSLGLLGCQDGSNSGGISPQPILAQIGEGYPLVLEKPDDIQPTREAPDAEAAKLNGSPRGLTAPPKLSPGVEEVVQLAQAQVGEEVLLAYVENSPAVFGLKAGDILYLHDLGISAPVIAAMIRHDEALQEPGWESSGDTTNEVPAESSPLEVEEPGPSTAVAVSTAPAADAPVTQEYFYTSLAPYGTWVDLPEYGWCWRPTVAVVDTTWRPYLHGGRWVYSDCGWYWHSYYSWGWAPFHYGRWHLGSGYGWVWVPDTCWGPAWVTWRHGGGYYGWAPLPPGAVYTSGIGLTYYGSGVSFSFGFGYSSSYYCFVPVGSFYSHRPWKYCVPHGHAGSVYNNSTVINNYVQGNGNNTVINVGPGSDAVASASRTEIQKVKVRDLAPGETRLVRAESLSRDGTTLNVYRPQLPEQSSTPPAEITRGQQEVQRRARELVASESAQAAVVRARSSDPVLSTRPTTAPRSVGPTSTPRVAGSNTAPRRQELNRNPVARSAAGTSAAVVRSEPQRTSNVRESQGVAGRSEASRGSSAVSPPQSTGETVSPRMLPQRATQPTTPRPAWSSPTPRDEPLRPSQGSPAPAAVQSRPEPSRAINPANSVTPRPSPQLTPRPSPGVPSPAPRTAVTPRSAPAPRPAIPRAQPMGSTRSPSIAPAPSRASAPSVVPARPSGGIAPARNLSPSPARPAATPSSAPRSSGGNRGR